MHPFHHKFSHLISGKSFMIGQISKMWFGTNQHVSYALNFSQQFHLDSTEVCAVNKATVLYKI